MAENKKSFILYADQIHTFEQMPDEMAGRLIKHILQYVNDLDPQTDDLVLRLIFEPIKQQLKRDLKQWEVNKEQRRQAGIRSAEVRKQALNENQRALTTVQRDSTKSTVNDNVNVNVNVNDNVNIKENKEKKSNGVHKFTPPSLLDVQNFIEQQSYSVNADSFFNFYESKGWMIGKNKMKDWKSAVRTWNTKNKAEEAARKDDRFISLDYDFDNLDNWKIIESENKLKPNHNVMAIEIRNGVNAGKFLDWETVSKSRKLRQFFEQFASSQIEGLSYFCKEKYGRRTN